jgi:hypothetical protein
MELTLTLRTGYVSISVYFGVNWFSVDLDTVGEFI